MSDFFKPEDCDVTGGAKAVPTNYGECTRVSFPKSISLARANELIRERGKVVRGSMRADGTHAYYGSDPFPVILNTHQALLICIKPIEADSAEKLVNDLAAHGRFAEGGYPLVSLNPEYWIERARKLLEKK